LSSGPVDCKSESGSKSKSAPVRVFVRSESESESGCSGPNLDPDRGASPGRGPAGLGTRVRVRVRPAGGPRSTSRSSRSWSTVGVRSSPTSTTSDCRPTRRSARRRATTTIYPPPQNSGANIVAPGEIKPVNFYSLSRATATTNAQELWKKHCTYWRNETCLLRLVDSPSSAARNNNNV